MAEEAFALSPISARAAQPREEDYEAIREAFMETSRGRWFLGEYAKRNRNADTRMVLDAVERIEHGLAAKEERTDDRLEVALAAIKSALQEARHTADAALEMSALENALAPVHKGARIIREISWRWREIGADSRICDLIDSQIGAIEEACGQIPAAEPKAAINAAFDLLDQRMRELGGQAQEAADTAASFDSRRQPNQSPTAPAEIVQANASPNGAPLTVSPVAVVVPLAESVTPESVESIADRPDMTTEAERAYDESVLDLVAIEMGAPATGYPDDGLDVDADPDPVLPSVSQHSAPEMTAEQREPTLVTPKPAALQPAHAPPPEPSLGSTLIESGIVRKPTSHSDVLAPIRRMSQAEKIALFS